MEQENIETQPNKKQYILIGGLALFICALVFGIYYLTNHNILLQKAQPLKQEATKTTKETATNIPSDVICYKFKNLEEALQRIDIACILDLSGTAQETTLSELIQLKNLSEINLSNNNISKFPEALFGLKNLLIINLSNNKLSTIPETIKKSELIKSLQILNLTGNPISASQKEVIKNLLPNVEITF